MSDEPSRVVENASTEQRSWLSYKPPVAIETKAVVVQRERLVIMRGINRVLRPETREDAMNEEWEGCADQAGRHGKKKMVEIVGRDRTN
jgi:hypothetical protein